TLADVPVLREGQPVQRRRYRRGQLRGATGRHVVPLLDIGEVRNHRRRRYRAGVGAAALGPAGDDRRALERARLIHRVLRQLRRRGARRRGDEELHGDGQLRGAVQEAALLGGELHVLDQRGPLLYLLQVVQQVAELGGGTVGGHRHRQRVDLRPSGRRLERAADGDPGDHAPGVVAGLQAAQEGGQVRPLRQRRLVAAQLGLVPGQVLVLLLQLAEALLEGDQLGVRVVGLAGEGGRPAVLWADQEEPSNRDQD